jgi:hypothetical protein
VITELVRLLGDRDDATGDGGRVPPSAVHRGDPREP